MHSIPGTKRDRPPGSVRMKTDKVSRVGIWGQSGWNRMWVVDLLFLPAWHLPPLLATRQGFFLWRTVLIRSLYYAFLML